ncbi:hypothetical protein BVRB_4g096980 [Beta vulgaris subsp. vulgaris]|uniref:Uncharacterized protein n=1 Tax=Beta vulgaris subsp. vulgaris TaxID=3555 RepID=A0A0J8BAN0_BETVV|nr:hypothetical protein BVRB_4g096980 [Beta vulgaris subsp. vulgaris]
MTRKPMHLLYLCLFLILALCIHLSLAHRASLTSLIHHNDPNQDGCCSIDGNCGPCNGGNGNCCQAGDFCYTCATTSPPAYILDSMEGNVAQNSEPIAPEWILKRQGHVNKPNPIDN